MEWLWMMTPWGIPFGWLAVGALVGMGLFWVIVIQSNHALAILGAAAIVVGFVFYRVPDAWGQVSSLWQWVQHLPADQLIRLIMGGFLHWVISNFFIAIGIAFLIFLVGILFILTGFRLSRRRKERPKTNRQVIVVRPESHTLANTMAVQQQVERVYNQAVDIQNKTGELGVHGEAVYLQMSRAIEAVRVSLSGDQNTEFQQYTDIVTKEMKKRLGQAIIETTQEFAKQSTNKLEKL